MQRRLSAALDLPLWAFASGAALPSLGPHPVEALVTDQITTVPGSESFGPYLVMQFSPQSAICAGKWTVESDFSLRLPVFDTREEAVKCAKRRQKAWLRRRHRSGWPRRVA